MSESSFPESRLQRFLESKQFIFAFMFGIIMYMVLCGYVLFFSGSLFLEAIREGWYGAEASMYDNNSFWLGYLYAFPSLCGVIGGLLVLLTRSERLFRFKVLLFVPAAVWSTQLTIGNLKWGFLYWTQWLYLVPIMSLCIFMLYGVVKQVSVPILAGAKALPQAEESMS